MDKQISISSKDKIFATGIFLQPVKCTINKIEQWRWIADSFEDDSFLDDNYVDPTEYADALKDMLNPTEEDQKQN